MGGGIHPERIGGELLMPVSYTITYHRNHNSSDTTTQSYTQSSVTFTLKTIDELGWEAPTGYTFHAWNTAADGSGQERMPGNTGSPSWPWYAIWERLPAVTYTTTSTELITVADAIRAKGGTSAALEWPSGFAQAISDISSGGGSVLTLYTNANWSVLYADQARTQTFIDYCGWSIDAAVAAIQSADSVKVEYSSGSVSETCFMTSFHIDTVEDERRVCLRDRNCVDRAIDITWE